MNVLPTIELPAPLVLQPLPGLGLGVPAVDPALAQPNSAAMQTVATETDNIPHSNYAQQILAMNANMLTVTAAFNQLQQQVVASHNGLVVSYNAMIANQNAIVARLDLVPMRAFNAAASTSAVLQYPPNVAVLANGPLPRTMSDAFGLTEPQYLQAINALIAAGAPGLTPIANDAGLLITRQHFLNYIGIYV